MTKIVWITRDAFGSGHGIWAMWRTKPHYLKKSEEWGLWLGLNNTAFATEPPPLAKAHNLRFKGGPRSIAKIETKRVKQ